MQWGWTPHTRWGGECDESVMRECLMRERERERVMRVNERMNESDERELKDRDRDKEW